jgi:hypothetical protein
MRDYVEPSNLVRAGGLSALATVLAVPRMVEGGFSLAFYVPMAWVSLTLAAGAATAWSRRGGMAGLFPGWRRTVLGLAAAVALLAVIVPLQVFWLDPLFRNAAVAAPESFRRLVFPASLFSIAALALWSAGFETLFFKGFFLALTARVTGSQWGGVALAVGIRTWVMWRQLSGAGVTEHAGLFLALAAANALAGCIIYVRTGLVPAMAFSAGLSLQHVPTLLD